MRVLYSILLFFTMCSNCLAQNHSHDEDTLYICKEDISSIQMDRRHIIITLDSNIVKLYENENVLRFHYLKFDFYPENIFLMDYYAAILLYRMTASVLENNFKNNFIWIRIWHLPESDEDVVSFKQSIKEIFSKEMIHNDF